MSVVKYEKDFDAWAMQTAQALREGMLSKAQTWSVSQRKPRIWGEARNGH